MIYFLFLVWFFILIKWADFLIKWAWSLAKRIWVSDLVIWLTIVAFWTSAPEIVVNIIASINWNSWLVLWNVLWSNISNVFLILWVWTIIYPLVIKKWTAFKEIPFSFLAILILGFLANDMLIDWSTFSVISRIDGVVLLSFFIIFLYYIYSIAKESQLEIKKEIQEKIKIEEIEKNISLGKSITFIIFWLLWLIFWGKWIVNWAVELASFFNISENIIWLTIVAIWTSLPELATSVVAAWKKRSDIAIWNIIWSNIFNVLLIVWISALINPIPFDLSSNRDILFTIFASLILFVFVFVWKKYVLQKYQWIILVWIYIFYLWLIIFNVFL